MKGMKKVFDYSDEDNILDVLHTRIACGFYHCLAITENNKKLYGWGKNQFGVLGLASHSLEEESEIYQTPVEIKLEKNKKIYLPLQVSCGKNHSVVLATYFSNDKFKPGEDEKTSKQGEVFIFGDATKGKLGIMENDNNLILKDQEQNSEELLRRIDINSYSDLNVTKVVKFPSGNPPIQMVSCGSTYTLALDASNCVYAWGEGSTGALGTGFFQDEPTPIKLTFPGNPKIKFINAGSFHSAAISINGNLYTWGIGSEGQLGHKSNLNINSPRMVEFFEESAAFVSCGMFHTACIDEKGFLFTWGGNKNGQLGHGDYEDRNFPLMVSFFKSYCVCNVNCGSNTTFVISEEGTVFSFGSNLNGKLVGAGILENELLQSNTFPTPLESLISIHNMGEVNECLEGSRVYQIATSNQFCMALTNKGHLLTWGNNNNGCLGRINEYEEEIDTDPFPNVISDLLFKNAKKESGPEISVSTHFVDIKAGLYHSVGLTDAGELYVWGSNQFSQHGISINKLKENANKLNDFLKQNLEFFSYTMLPSLVDCFDIKLNKKVTHIACGYEFVFAIQNNKIVYSWGRNTHGQCGIGSVSNTVEEPHLISFFDSHILKEVVCGENHTLILNDKGDLYACGCSNGGKLGLGFMTTVQTSPKQINLKGVINIACGPYHSMAIVKESKKDNNPKNVLYTWGSGWDGQLGHGNRDNIYNPKYLETKYTFTSISCGTHHSAGITDDFKLAVWGPYKYLGVTKSEELEANNAAFFVPNLHPICLQNENLKFASVILGDKYNLAISLQKELYYWGIFDIIYKKVIKTAAAQGTNEEAAYEKNVKNPTKLETDIKFEAVSVSSNHALGISSKYNKLYSWGIDANTGRLGLGYEFIDEELEEETKKIQKQKYIGISNYDETVSSPIFIHFLSYLLNRLSREAIKKQAVAAQSQSEFKALNLHKGAQNSNFKINSAKIIEKVSTQNLQMDSGKKSSQFDNKKMIASTINEKSSKISSVMDIEINFVANKYDLYENCQSSNKSDNLLNNISTQSLFHENQSKYQEIRHGFQTILNQILQKKTMKKRIIGIILKRISSYPFEAKFISKESKHEKIEIFPQFFQNKKKFQAIFTVFQLHPCYLLNIYKSDKLGSEPYFKLVVETFGDLENNNRKTAIYINLCQMILKHEVDKLARSLTGDEYDIDLSLDPNSRFYVFVKLFIHLFNSSFANKKWLKICLKKIQEGIDAEIWESEQSTKTFKQSAIVFRDILTIPADVDKKKFYSEKVTRLVKILKKVINEYSGIKQNNNNLETSKHIKRLADKIRRIFMKQSNRIQNLTEEEIKKRILSLVFTPLYQELYAIELIGKAKYDDETTHKKERILVKNYNAINDALKHFIKGKLVTSPDQKETWLDDLNNFISSGESARYNLYLQFVSNQTAKKNSEEEHQTMLKHIFKHSVSNKQEIIQVSLKNLVCVSNLIHSSLDEWKVMNPLKKEILYIIDQKLVEEGQNFHGYQFKPEDDKIIFNLKLKTKQLHKIDMEKKIKQCKICKTYLIEDFLRTEDLGLVDEFPILNPESLESLLLQIISIKKFEKTRFDLLFSNKSSVEKILEDFLIKHKKEIKYENIQIIRSFLKQFQETLNLKKAKNGSDLDFLKSNPNEVTQFAVMKEIKKNLEEKALKALQYINKNEVLNKTLKNICEKYVTNRDVVPMRFYERSIKLCFYGLANTEFEKALLNNPMALSGKIGASIRATSMSNDLYENMQYLSDEKEKNFSLFGCYSYKLLKSKKILENLNEEVLYRIELPKLRETLNIADTSKTNKLKDNFYYLFSDNKRLGLEISLCYRQIHFNFYRWFCGMNNKQKKNFEIIIETFEIKEEDLLIIRKRERELEAAKADKIILEIGKYSKFNLSRFLELINSLQNHYMIYDEIFVKGA